MHHPTMNQAPQAAAFDSYRFVKQLTDYGLDENIARVLAEDKAREVQYLNANLVTQENLAIVEANLKRDIAETNKHIAAVEAGLKKDIAVVQANLQKDIAVAIANLKSDLIKWIFGIVLSAVLGVAALQTTLMLWLVDRLVAA